MLAPPVAPTYSRSTHLNVWFPWAVLTMIYALCGPPHFVLRPVALGENDRSLWTNEILCQSAVVNLLNCLAAHVSPWRLWSWRIIYKKTVFSGRNPSRVLWLLPTVLVVTEGSFPLMLYSASPLHVASRSSGRCSSMVADNCNRSCRSQTVLQGMALLWSSSMMLANVRFCMSW